MCKQSLIIDKIFTGISIPVGKHEIASNRRSAEITYGFIRKNRHEEFRVVSKYIKYVSNADVSHEPSS